MIIPSTSKQRSTNMNTYMNRILSNVSDDYFFYLNNEKEWKNVERNENFLVCNPTTPANFFHIMRG